MSAGNYSKDQIEEKRLLALRKKAEKESKGEAGTSKANFNDCSARYKSEDGNSGATWPSSTPNVRHGNYCDSSWSKNNSCPGAMRTPKKYERPSPIEVKKFFGSTQTPIGTCAMITETRFVVDVEYNPNLIRVFKNMPDKLYDQQSRRWSFPLADYDKFMVACHPLRPQVIIAGIPQYVLTIFKRNLNRKTADMELTDLSSIDRKLIESLMPFQREGICYGISKKGRCLIADDMGLGKTIQALGLAHYYRENWPLLIVTPSSIRYQWSEAIYNFLPSVPSHYVQHFNSGKDYVGDAKITIVSYDLLVRSIDLFKRHIYGFVILDESHTVKTGKSARAKAVQSIASQARHVVLLTGTPALSRPIELYSQISLVVPSFMGYHDYGVRYCAAAKKTFGWDYSGSSNMQELHLLLRSCCLIRRLKSDVLKQLPAKIRQVVMLDPALIKKATKEATLIAEKLKGNGLKSSERDRAILQYYHESSSQRLAAVCNYVIHLLEAEQKFLIYAHHQIVLDSICELLASKDIRFIRIDGKTLPEQRKTQVDRFQDSDGCLVAVLSITAANAGITLTAAQLVVFAELFWNPGILCQAEDRAHRIGQASSVVIRYLVAKNTADDHLWPLIQRKINVLSKVGLDQDFCLDKAKVSEHKAKTPSPAKSRQATMDSFVSVTTPAKSPPTKSQGKLNITGTEELRKVYAGQEQSRLAQTSEHFEHLLDLDEDDFAHLDLDNIL